MTVQQFNKNCEARTKVLEGLLEQNKVELRRVYSINLASYLSSRGYNYTIHDDEKETGLKYFVFKDDVTQDIIEYKKNKQLQNFIRCFREIKEELHS